MRRTILFSLILVGASLCVPAGGPVMAQDPGASRQPGSNPIGQPPRPGPPALTNDPVTAPETTPDTAQLRSDDRKFVKDAAVGGMAEVELGKLAAQKASSEAVKQFGQKMVDDHSKANDELKQIAAKQKVNIPDSLDSKHQARVDKLSKLSGAEFDKAYIKDQLKDHQEDVKAFQHEAQNGSDPDIKGFASKTLPTLQEHLSMVKDLSKGKTTSSMNRVPEK